MDLFSGLRSGRESLLAHGTALAASADNISNTSTTGYKGNRAEFGDLIASGQGALMGPMVNMNIGNGTAIDKISTIQIAGAIEPTGRSLDAAIQGRGFFVLQTPEGGQLFTRAGNFQANREGFLVSDDGFPVLGFTEAGAEAVAAPLNINAVAAAAQATTAVTLTGNLDADGADVVLPAQFTSYEQLAAATSFQLPVPIIDSLGASRDISVHFFKTADRAWTVQAFADGGDVGGVTGVPVAISPATQLGFTDAGVPTVADAALTLNAPWSNGAAPSTTAINLAGFTQFAGFSAINSITGNGRQAGTVVGTEFGEDGSVNAVLDSGARVPVGQLAIAMFNNEEGLRRLGDNNFSSQEGATGSGEVLLGRAETEGRGQVIGSALENSNVDLSTEFIKVIQYQRAYQAGSQVVQTMNGLLDNTIQIA